MSRLYDTIEPSVIDEQMLKNAVEEQGPKGEAGRIAKQEGIDFGDVLSLRLDFKNILKIDNLWSLVNLTKLQMDNNIIERIEGLDLLVNLEWLDLSFNNIEIIEGLDKLTKMKDLTLYNNRISKIENMESLTQLHVFSIGNNSLKQLDNVIYLRKFKSLRTLNLSGNPFSEEANYKEYVIAHLPDLVYLDFRLIDESAREAATEKYRYSIEELVHDETVAKRKQDEMDEKQKERQLHKIAFVEDLNGPWLFDSMYAEDPEASKLGALPGMEEILDAYKEKFTTICQEIFEFGLKEHEKREAEVASFFSCLEEATQENNNTGVKHIHSYIEYKKKVFLDYTSLTDSSHMATLMKEIVEEIRKLWDTLMGLEMELVDQLEDTIKDFERNMADLVTAFVEHVQGLMTQLRDLENAHHEKVSDIAVVTLEKLMKNELEEDLPDDLRMLFVDKDTIMNAVSASHDTHLLKIDNKEDDMLTRATTRMQTLNEKIHNDEVLRNRKRVSEINNLVDHFRDEAESYEVTGPM
ncbi:dynein regulatory complex subunit 3-like [Stylophora pistillata]|uniref:dynein regulatory complex subunit 3-like n=1 Tax=Stylophora pistillata TaxID=50429 RepID=UPI000C04F8F4|nr:dynein regulatory complex subunit 3-like [Stylophora pistillata]